MKKLRLLLICLAISITGGVKAQFYPFNPYYNPYNQGYALGQQIGSAIQRNSKYGRNQLRKAIKKWGECNNGSLSLEHGAVALYGSNGYFCSAAVDERISAKLKSINNSGGTINDVNITENGYFIIVFNGTEWYGALPSALKSALEGCSYGTKFKSISFNEDGTYAITTSDGFQSNNSAYQAFYDDNKDDFGELLSVNICGDGAVFCYSDKARYCGRIPSEVESAIRGFSHTANFVKFNKHGDYLICDKYGSYSYSIGDADAGGNASTVYYDYMKERIQIQKKKVFAKWEDKGHHVYRDSTNVHKVFCTGDMLGEKFMMMEVLCKKDYNSAPSLFFDFNMVFDKEDELYDFVNNFTETQKNITLKINLSNGEILTTYEGAIYSNILKGIDVGTSLVSLRSDRQSLSGNLSSIKYLVTQLTSFNIKSISFKNFTVEFNNYETKGQLFYDFYRLADESGRSNWLPN